MQVLQPAPGSGPASREQRGGGCRTLQAARLLDLTREGQALRATLSKVNSKGPSDVARQQPQKTWPHRQQLGPAAALFWQTEPRGSRFPAELLQRNMSDSGSSRWPTNYTRR